MRDWRVRERNCNHVSYYFEDHWTKCHSPRTKTRTEGTAVRYLLSYQDRWHRKDGCATAEDVRGVREQADAVGAYGDLCPECFVDGEVDD